MTREQRAKLMVEDLDAYMELVPDNQGYWLQLLEGIAKTNGINGDLEGFGSNGET